MAEFSFTFDGEAVRDGEIDIADIAPTLLALDQAMKATAKIVIGPRADISLKIRATKPGSFEVFLNAVASGEVGLAWGLVKQFYASDDGQTAKAVIETIAGGLTIAGIVTSGVLEIIKISKGKKISNQEKIDDSSVRISFDDQDIIVPIPVAQAYQDHQVRISIEKVISSSLDHKGIDSIRFDVAATSIKIDKEEAEYFKINLANDDTTFDSVYEKIFSIQSLSFKKGNKWRLHDGNSTRSVVMLDQEFLDKVDRSEVSFTKDDILICEVREISVRSKKGFKSEFTILRVIDHRPKAHTPALV